MKASKILNLLRTNLHHSSKTAKSKAYTGLVHPHLEYAAPVWSPHKVCDISNLEKVQKRAARWIGAKWNRTQWDKSYEECRHNLSWLTLTKRHEFLICCQTYKIMNKMDCLQFSDFYSFNTLNTRSHSLSLVCKYASLNSYRFSFFVNSIFLWNLLPATIAYSCSYSIFKYNLKTYFFNSFLVFSLLKCLSLFVLFLLFAFIYLFVCLFV